MGAESQLRVVDASTMNVDRWGSPADVRRDFATEVRRREVEIA
jgi:hypothetical protein